MRHIRIARHVLFLFVFGWMAAVVPPASAQKAAGSPGGSSGGAGSAGAGSAGSTGRSPSVGNPYPTSVPNNSGSWPSRPIFLYGQVLLDDGSKASGDIRIERVCNGSPHLEGHTDSKGRFSFQVGQNGTVDTDASDSTSGSYGRPGTLGSSTMGGNGIGGRASSNALFGCQLRAAYPGYRSDALELGRYGSANDSNIDVGSMILHRLGSTPAGTISVASALVPKNARKAYEKGEQLAEKGDFEQAEKRFAEATAAYPKYSMAWFALGQLQQKQGNAQDAKKSYEGAVAADAKYAEAYDRLAQLSGQSQQWEPTVQYSNQAILLDPIDYPSSFWYNAVANYQLKKPAEAEKSIKDLLRIDKAHRYPEAERLYAELLLVRGDQAAAAAHLRAYVALSPNGTGAAAAKQTLAKLQQQAEAEPGTPSEPR